MIVHKDSARDMRCCGPEHCGRMAGIGEAPNRVERRCIGWQCMAWRVASPDLVGPSRSMRFKADDHLNYGYCGLAGEVQCVVSPADAVHEAPGD